MTNSNTQNDDALKDAQKRALVEVAEKVADWIAEMANSIREDDGKEIESKVVSEIQEREDEIEIRFKTDNMKQAGILAVQSMDVGRMILRFSIALFGKKFNYWRPNLVVVVDGPARMSVKRIGYTNIKTRKR